jgi:hypothetical protein
LRASRATSHPVLRSKLRAGTSIIALASGALLLLVMTMAFAQAPNVPTVRIAIMGNPVHQVAWTDDSLEALKTIGFNEIQLNIAWSSKPFGEALNLMDVVTVPGEAELPGTAERRIEIKRRIGLARKHGLRVLFHFGSP